VPIQSPHGLVFLTTMEVYDRVGRNLFEEWILPLVADEHLPEIPNDLPSSATPGNNQILAQYNRVWQTQRALGELSTMLEFSELVTWLWDDEEIEWVPLGRSDWKSSSKFYDILMGELRLGLMEIEPVSGDAILWDQTSFKAISSETADVVSGWRDGKPTAFRNAKQGLPRGAGGNSATHDWVLIEAIAEGEKANAKSKSDLGRRVKKKLEEQGLPSPNAHSIRNYLANL
jgi:hypothetical protein